jgi:hypothetical protein
MLWPLPTALSTEPYCSVHAAVGPVAATPGRIEDANEFA